MSRIMIVSDFLNPCGSMKTTWSLRTEVQRGLFPILVIHYVVWELNKFTKCHGSKIEDFSIEMRSLPLALALVFSIPFGIRMPFGL